ncbi:MAG TPA: L,D-transpeptidase [Rhizobacter sp.]|nr:L,D-transpeptidase [Rhizobacter sp.]
MVAACVLLSPVWASAFDQPTDKLSADVHDLHRWALDTGDTHQQPFAIVDKKAARIFVFDGQGRLVGASNALLGQAPGDHQPLTSVSDSQVAQLPLADRTTPAGRFASQPGRNLSGEAVVWFDYAAALAIHRVRPGASQARRLRDLASDTPDDNRASLGCVVVTPAFFEAVLQPTLGRQRGVVYVLPEDRPVQAMFGRPLPLAQAR